MVYDSTDGYLLLFGGEQTNPGPIRYYNDTWKFANGVWTNLTTSHAPTPRFGFLFADDPADGAVVLFGGIGAAHADLNNTWEFKAGAWINVTAGTSPPVRFWGSMSYNTATSSVLLFGGNQFLSPSYSNDTWSFHAGTWTRLTPTTLPPARDDQNQVDDVADNEVVMFGGLDTIDYVNDTWTYAAGTWARATSPTVPDARAGAGMAYDAAAQAVVMYGGYPANTYYYSTWVFHAGTWTRYALSPTPGAGTIWGQMAYDGADQYVVLFQGDGAYNSTWELNFTGGISPPLAVAANALPVSGAAPLLVTFTASASGGRAPFAYAWNFGDRSTSSLGNTTHTYPSPGAYSVTLNVSDSASGKVTQSWDINVLAAGLTATIAATPSTTSINQTVTFTSTVYGGAPPYTFLWNFADLKTASTQNTTHQYATNGTYLVVLVVHDSAEASVSRNVTITVTSSANSTPASSALTSWLLLAALIAVAVVLLAIALRRRRRRPPPPGNTGPVDTPGPPA